jgi:hypothetical protein
VHRYVEVDVRRSLLTAVAAGVLFCAALPSVAVAGAPYLEGIHDQATGATFVDGQPLVYWSNSDGLTQTITPGITGALTQIQMPCLADGTGTLTLRVDSASASGECGSDFWGKVAFVFSAPLPNVVAGTPFTISFDTGSSGTGVEYRTSPYSGGAAADHGNPIIGDGGSVSSFYVETFVAPGPTTTYGWSLASVPAGASTPVTLTAVTSFPGIWVVPDVSRNAAPNANIPLTYTLKLGSLPTWFTPTGMDCSAAVTNCAVANFSTGLNVSSLGLATTVTVHVQGTAAPTAGANGTSGQAGGNGCVAWTAGSGTETLCGAAQAALGVGAAAPTPSNPPTNLPTQPPTATLPLDASGTGGSLGLLLTSLVGFLVLVFAVRQFAAHRK